MVYGEEEKSREPLKPGRNLGRAGIMPSGSQRFNVDGGTAELGEVDRETKGCN
jgi:hypothetical protein